VDVLSEETVNEMSDNILNRIIKDDMTQREQAKAVFDWTVRNVGYTARGSHDSVYESAYRAMRGNSGDCFTFYAVMEVLLTRLGIENMRITRVGGNSNHFWNLVNVGDGWYHVDATPTRITINRFMFTDSQAEDYTNRMLRYQYPVRNYYVYDKTLYPEVVQ
jgi:hypothetical protein